MLNQKCIKKSIIFSTLLRQLFRDLRKDLNYIVACLRTCLQEDTAILSCIRFDLFLPIYQLKKMTIENSINLNAKFAKIETIFKIN